MDVDLFGGFETINSCRTVEQRGHLAAKIRLQVAAGPGKGTFSPLYHVTTPEKATLIARDGFKDHAAAKGFPNVVTYRFDAGVWLADAPPITAIPVDQFLGHADEAWLEVLATPQFYNNHMIGNEWNDDSWPTRQWLIPADAVNQLIRRAVPLSEVLRLRLADATTEHHRHYDEKVLGDLIDETMKGDVRLRWRTALAEAVAAAEVLL